MLKKAFPLENKKLILPSTAINFIQRHVLQKVNDSYKILGEKNIFFVQGQCVTLDIYVFSPLTSLDMFSLDS